MAFTRMPPFHRDGRRGSDEHRARLATVSRRVCSSFRGAARRESEFQMFLLHGYFLSCIDFQRPRPTGFHTPAATGTNIFIHHRNPLKGSGVHVFLPATGGRARSFACAARRRSRPATPARFPDMFSVPSRCYGSNHFNSAAWRQRPRRAPVHSGVRRWPGRGCVPLYDCAWPATPTVR